jgi:osmotically-inducible protein OsmY
MRSDSDIRRDVEDELRWDPQIDPTDIAVGVNGGVVTLAGFVRSYSERRLAETAAKRVAGVLAVANDLEVRLPDMDQRPDPDIARDAVARIKEELPYAWENIRVLVKNARLTLEGEVEWNYQRERAEAAVHGVRGVEGITNSIEVKQDRRGVAASSRDRRQPHHDREQWERGDPDGHRALVGRTSGGGKGRLVGWCSESRQ